MQIVIGAGCFFKLSSFKSNDNRQHTLEALHSDPQKALIGCQERQKDVAAFQALDDLPDKSAMQMSVHRTHEW